LTNKIEIDIFEKSTGRTKHIEIPISQAECNLMVRHTENNQPYKVTESAVNKILQLQRSIPLEEQVDFEKMDSYLFNFKLVIGKHRETVEDMYNRIENKDSFI